MTRTSLSSCASRYPLAIPATTSALMALRLSGRLMVIQNACPRFSRITLLLSAIVPLFCLPSLVFAKASLCQVSANICGRMAVDRKQDLDCGDSLFHPDLVVVECGAADGGDCLG